LPRSLAKREQLASSIWSANDDLIKDLDKDDETRRLKYPLHYAVARSDVKEVERLLAEYKNEYGAGSAEFLEIINAPDKVLNKTPLDYTAFDHRYPYHRKIPAVSTVEDRIEIAKMLIENGADIDNHTGTMCLLSTAARCGDVKFVEFLLQNNAQVNREDSFTFCDMIAMAKDISNKKAESNSPCEKAKGDSQRKKIKGDFSLWGTSPVDEAIKMSEVEVLEMLIKYGAIITREHLSEAILHSSQKRIVEIWLDQGLDINYRVPGETVPLEEAIATNNFNIIELLINRGAIVPAPYGRVDILQIGFELLKIHRIFVVHAASSKQRKDVEMEKELDQLILLPGEKEHLMILFQKAWEQNTEKSLYLDWEMVRDNCHNKEQVQEDRLRIKKGSRVD
jgi:ankyrin repeat protein